MKRKRQHILMNGFEFKDISYIKIIREIDTSIDNENKTVRNVLEKTHPEKLI